MKKMISVLLTTVLLTGLLSFAVYAAPGAIRLVDVSFFDDDGNAVTTLPADAEQITVSTTVQYENYYNPRHQKGTTSESLEAFCDVIDANAKGSAALYVAHYDADNKLIGVALLTDKIFGGNNTFSIPIETASSTKISVLLWDGSTLKPMTQIQKLDSVQNGNKILSFPYYEIGKTKKFAVINHVDNIIWLETDTVGDEIMLNGRPNGQSDFSVDAGATFTQPNYFYGGNDAVRVKNGMTCTVTAANGAVRTYTIYLDKPLNGTKMGSYCNAIGDTAGLPQRSGVYWDANGFAKTGTIKTDGGRTYWRLDDNDSSSGIILGMKDSMGGANRNSKFYKTEYRMTFRMSDMKGNSWNKLFFNMGGLDAGNAPVVKLALSNEGDIAYASDGNAIGDGQQKYSLRYYHHNNTKGEHIKTLNVGEWVELKTVIRQGMTNGVPKVEIYVNDEVVYSTPYGYMDADATGVAGFPTGGLRTLDNYCYSSGSNGSFQFQSDSNGLYCFDLDEIWAEGSALLAE